MEKDFTIDSETFTTDGYCDELSIEIDISSRYGDDAEWQVEHIWNNTKSCDVDFESLNDEDKEKIEDIAQKLADENAHEAWQDGMITMADFDRE